MTINVLASGHVFSICDNALTTLNNECVYEVLDNTDKGKDGKPKKLSVSFIGLTLTQDLSIMLVYIATGYKVHQSATNSNILDYDMLFIASYAKTDLFQATLNQCMRDNNFAILLQSSGARDSFNNEPLTLSAQVKLSVHSVVLYELPKGAQGELVRIKGTKYTHDDFMKVATDKQKQVYIELCNAKRQGK